MTAPADQAGQKVACTSCGQRLQIPIQQKTILAQPLAAPPPLPTPTATERKADKKVWLASLLVILAITFLLHRAGVVNNLVFKRVGILDTDPRAEAISLVLAFGFVLLTTCLIIAVTTSRWFALRLLLIAVGTALVLYYWLVYDTTVPVYPTHPEIERVYNTGRMQNRVIGIVVGFGTLAVGVTLSVVRRKGKKLIAAD